MPNLSDSSSDDNTDKRDDVVQLFASDSEVDVSIHNKEFSVRRTWKKEQKREGFAKKANNNNKKRKNNEKSVKGKNNTMSIILPNYSQY